VELSKELEIGVGSIWAWAHFLQRPKLAHYLTAFLSIGKPRNAFVWLGLSNSPRHAVPYGQLIQVPSRIRDWSDIAHVLHQLGNLGGTEGRRLSYRFGFFLGMLFGDASKRRHKATHRHVELQLSMKYQTNVRIGDFMTECARSLGLQMRRDKDRVPYAGKPNGFYVWRSRSSALIDWMFNVCLGLKDGELTTYDPVRMEWALDTPKGFRRGLVQGIAESDGSVSIASQTVEFWIEQDRDFFAGLLQTFGVKSFKNRQALSVTKNEVAKLGMIPPFSPVLQTVRFLRLQKLLRA